MPKRALRMCSSPGCPVVVEAGKCPRHAAQAAARELARQQDVNARRPDGSMSAYSSQRWREARARFISAHHRCDCGAPARYVDHVRPWRSFPSDQQEAAFWDEANWAGKCGPCHSRKTSREDGGFGHPRKT